MIAAENEIKTATEGPAIYANRFVAKGNDAGLRLSFLEADQNEGVSVLRASVLLSYQDAIELRNLLSHLLGPVELQINSVKGKALKS